MRIEPGQHREKRAGGVIFEPMGRERAPAGPPGKAGRGSGALARRRIEKEGGMIFEPMERETAGGGGRHPGGAARKDRPGKRSVCPAEDEKGGGLCR